MIEARPGARPAVVCEDRPEIRRSVVALLRRCGFGEVREVTSFSALRDQVRALHPGVVVLAFPLAGVSSLDVVRRVHREAPLTRIVLLSAYDGLAAAAVEAGAWALVAEDDPQALRRVLLDIASSDGGAGQADEEGDRGAPSAVVRAAAANGTASTNPSS